MDSFVHSDPKTRQLVARARRLAKSKLPLLITGETGTGKEVLAREIHRNGHGGPFVVLDCSTLNCETARSEIFCAVRGAYTGASSDRPGLVETAHGGTLFIDEIGEASADLQLLFLRFLQSGEYRKVGGTAYDKADVRIIAATNRNLTEEVEAGRFRKDLLYRIQVGTIDIPPLRTRKPDVSTLLDHFVSKYEQMTEGGLRIDPRTRLHLLNREWPGNVRELENSIALLAAGSFLEPGEQPDLSEVLGQDESEWMDLPFRDARKRADEKSMRAYLEARLVASVGNVTKASRSCGIGRQYFQTWMSRVGIDARQYR